jgi:hypothetical protein
VTRSVRFFGVTALLKRYGPSLLPIVERRLAMAAGVIVAVLVLAFLGLRLLPSS